MQISELLPAAAAEDFAALAVRLPASFQLQLSEQKSDEDRRDLVITCARVAWWSRNMPPPPSDEELRKYFATLDAAETERLEKLDPQQMKRELIRHYLFRRPRDSRGRVGEGFGPTGRGFGPPRGEKPGARRDDVEGPQTENAAIPSTQPEAKSGDQETARPPDKS